MEPDLPGAKRQLLLSPDLTLEEKSRLENVSPEVHAGDTMYAGNALHYLSVGLSAVRCIQESLRSAGQGFANGSILDLPSGYGRVLRFLRVWFPQADITAVEIEPGALDFCQKNFAATPVLSTIPLSELQLARQFDLIWCGSLFTHIDEPTAADLLRFFHDHLSERGLCVFTTHGRYCAGLMQRNEVTYGLTAEAQQKIIREVRATGYGYADYPNQSGYGISSVTPQRLSELAGGVGGWEMTLFRARGWDHHQDVYAFAK
jgi:SAM-dependent methyltransferase